VDLPITNPFATIRTLALLSNQFPLSRKIKSIHPFASAAELMSPPFPTAMAATTKLISEPVYYNELYESEGYDNYTHCPVFNVPGEL
jgi:hypothetical protein